MPTVAPHALAKAVNFELSIADHFMYRVVVSKRAWMRQSRNGAAFLRVSTAFPGLFI